MEQLYLQDDRLIKVARGEISRSSSRPTTRNMEPNLYCEGKQAYGLQKCKMKMRTVFSRAMDSIKADNNLN